MYFTCENGVSAIVFFSFMFSECRTFPRRKEDETKWKNEGEKRNESCQSKQEEMTQDRQTDTRHLSCTYHKSSTILTSRANALSAILEVFCLPSDVVGQANLL